MDKININEFSFLVIDNEATMIIPAQKDECEHAELFYNGNNVLLLKRNSTFLVLKDFDKTIRSILKKQADILICEETLSKEISQAYSVNIQIDKSIPDVDTVEQDFDNDMLFLKDILGEQSYCDLKMAIGL